MVVSSAALGSRVTALTRPRSNCTSKLQTNPLVKESAQNQETRNCQTEYKYLVISSKVPDGSLIPRYNGQLTVGRNLTSTSTLQHYKTYISVSQDRRAGDLYHFLSNIPFHHSIYRTLQHITIILQVMSTSAEESSARTFNIRKIIRLNLYNWTFGLSSHFENIFSTQSMIISHTISLKSRITSLSVDTDKQY
jgi:hypothetical protein